jgi:hypothetical protein
MVIVVMSGVNTGVDNVVVALWREWGEVSDGSHIRQEGQRTCQSISRGFKWGGATHASVCTWRPAVKRTSRGLSEGRVCSALPCSEAHVSWARRTAY